MVDFDEVIVWLCVWVLVEVWDVWIEGRTSSFDILLRCAMREVEYLVWSWVGMLREWEAVCGRR